jgi:hypothetical protein
VSNSYTLPAPSGGLNYIDAIDAMPESDALELINVYPQGTNAAMRGGSARFCSAASTSPARTLIQLPLQDGSIKLVRASNNALMDITTGSEVDVTGTTTPTSDDWSGHVFRNRLFLVNGADTAQVWTGTGNFADCTFTGVTLSSLASVSSYRSRLYFVEGNSLSFWYGGVDSTSGALTEFDLSSVATRGGYLLFAGAWSLQQAISSQTLFCAVTSEGEILAYAGSYPGDPNSWTLTYSAIVGQPLGRRAFVRVDNDLWLLTKQGIVSFSALFSSTPTVALDAVGRKINPLISSLARSIPTSHLWSGVHWPNGRRVFLCAPRAGNDICILVLNTDTGAWCKYDYGATDPAVTIGIFDGVPYFGAASGHVNEMEVGQTDNGSGISIDILTAFTFFRDRTTYKNINEVRPLVRAIRGLSFGLGVQTDFDLTARADIVASAPGVSTPWGSPWGSPWSSSTEYLLPRFAVAAQGHSGALRIRGTITGTPLEFNAFDVRFRAGGQV